MLDFSFSEILLCFVVALVVLGPERLPAVARAVGRWTGKTRVYLRNLSTEIERESQVADLKKAVENAQRLMREESQSMQSHAQKLMDQARLDSPASPPKPADPPPPHG